MRNLIGRIDVGSDFDADITLAPEQQRAEWMEVNPLGWYTRHKIIIELPESDADGYFTTIYGAFGDGVTISTGIFGLKEVTIPQGNATRCWVDTTGVRSMDAMFAPVWDAPPDGLADEESLAASAGPVVPVVPAVPVKTKKTAHEGK